MWLTICNRQFNTESIRSITITERNVLIDTEEDFYNLKYKQEEDIIEAKGWLRLQNITEKDISEAVKIIMLICNDYINKKEQCNSCPLKKQTGCVFQHIPIDWRDEYAVGTNETEQYFSITTC